MPEEYNRHTIFSLKEVTDSIQKTIAGRYGSSYWIKAEMNKLNYYSYSGHCYPDLVEKANGRVVAQMRAIIWAKDFQHINQRFKKVLDAPLQDGINILLLAKIQFDGVHGMSLRITDIDPVFSLGALEKEKQATLDKLHQEGLMERNKQLSLPLLPQRIAIISVETSKGYADFLKILEDNPHHYRFFHHLFPANLQGEKAVSGIRRQLLLIRKCRELFDAVVIVRGGGGDVGLSAFNNFDLARDVALFPLPVLTGIGHATNKTVVEMVAHQNAITPTEIASLFLQRFLNFEHQITQIQNAILQLTRQRLDREKASFKQLVHFFRSLTFHLLAHRKNELSNFSINLAQGTRVMLRQEHIACQSLAGTLNKVGKVFFQRQKERVDAATQKLALLDPENILKRGYSITRKKGKIVQNIEELEAGDQITTKLSQGNITSDVTGLSKN